MIRRNIVPRYNWEDKVKEQGFLFYKNESYYSETCAYEFTATEVDAIETATAEIFDMCLAVVDHVIKNKLWDEFFIPRQYADLIEWSWKEDQPSFYGRLDLAYRDGEIKLLEFNADTPTSLLEASVIQWYWLQDFNKSYDQFNSIHEKLVDHIKVCAPYFLSDKLHFTCVPNHTEDFMTVKYIERTILYAFRRAHKKYL
jgi:glutathionylspermidine synthase